MSISKPYRRIARPFSGTDGGWMTNDIDQYFEDTRNIANLAHSVRAMQLLDTEIQRIFDYVEPDDQNLQCFSHELYALFLRACTEFESNAKGVLIANGYNPRKSQWNAQDYCKLNQAMKLNEYVVTVLPWQGAKRIVTPFSGWGSGHALTWYQNYNIVKHSRSEKFAYASLENTVLAVTGVLALLFAQFNMYAFDAHHATAHFTLDHSVWSHPRSSFALKTPSSWLPEEEYDFNWSQLRKTDNPFDNFPFSQT
jgi:hypothetical protein